MSITREIDVEAFDAFTLAQIIDQQVQDIEGSQGMKSCAHSWVDAAREIQYEASKGMTFTPEGLIVELSKMGYDIA